MVASLAARVSELENKMVEYENQQSKGGVILDGAPEYVKKYASVQGGGLDGAKR